MNAVDSLAKQVLAELHQMPGLRQVIETHMAHVFLTDTLAYKLKKPLRVGFSDCRTLAARQHACAEEVRLNRDLAAGVYLGVVPLTQDAGGLALEGSGEVVDWLVKMRRLPANRMLDALIKARLGPTDAEVRTLAERIAGFYRTQAASLPLRGIYRAHLDREQKANAAHLSKMRGHLPRPAAAVVADGVTARLRAVADEIDARDRAGMVVEGHGDLRPEHVCLTDPPVIFDRVETALELRVADVFDEAMSLAVECALLGEGRIGDAMARALGGAGFAPPSAQLLRTYVLLRLVTRARLMLDHLQDPAPRTPEVWPRRAQTYLDAAVRLEAGGRSAVPEQDLEGDDAGLRSDT